jgi:hypothetical protein
MLESPRLASEGAIAFLLCVVLYVITVGTQSQKLDSFLPLVTVERTSVLSRESNDHALSRRQPALVAPAIGASGRSTAFNASVDEVRYFP